MSSSIDSRSAVIGTVVITRMISAVRSTLYYFIVLPACSVVCNVMRYRTVVAETLVAASSRVHRLAVSGREISSDVYCRLLRLDSVPLILTLQQCQHLCLLMNVRI